MKAIIFCALSGLAIAVANSFDPDYALGLVLGLFIGVVFEALRLIGKMM